MPSNFIPEHSLRMSMLGLAAAVLLTACDRTAPLSASSRATESELTGEPRFTHFSDVPVPSGAEMDIDRSLVLGDRETWIGRLVMAVGMNAGKAYDFYFGEMPRFGWTPITSVRAETSVLTYTRGGRVATIQIRSGRLTGATVSMTVSPKGATAQPYAGLSRDNDQVSTSPLR